jgi:iron complex transport system substrate-binding protein
MPRRSPAFLVAALSAFILSPVSGRAGEFVDAAGRHVVVPVRVERVLAANEAAAVFLFALAPEKLIGWPQPLAAAARAYLPAKFAALPVTGRLTGAEPTLDADRVARWRPGLILDWANPSPAARALADRITQETRVATILLDPGFQDMPSQLRRVGLVIGAQKRGRDLAEQAADMINELRGTLLTRSPTKRPRVYYGLGADGLSSGSVENAAIDEVGAINVAASAGPRRITRGELLAWNPSIVIAESKSFYDALRRDPDFASLAAVREHRVYLAPRLPFGWLDRPDGINRLIGLDWLSALFYPKKYGVGFSSKLRLFYATYYGIKLSDKALTTLYRGTGMRLAATAVPSALPGSANAPFAGPKLGPALAPSPNFKY